MSTCYALALSAGDQSAAYQAGVLQGLAEIYSAGEANYTAVSGVAGGAVNAAILANFAVGSELSAADAMKAFWDASTNATLYKEWPGGLAEGLLIKGGLYNQAPLRKFLTE